MKDLLTIETYPEDKEQFRLMRIKSGKTNPELFREAVQALMQVRQSEQDK